MREYLKYVLITSLLFMVVFVLVLPVIFFMSLSGIKSALLIWWYAILLVATIIYLEEEIE